ncbi:MAG: DUF362 domain-containing protein [Methanomicrobiales archaeon]
MKPVYVTGIPGPSDQVVRDTLADFILKSTNNFQWLTPGDIVLLKPALNSGDPYPSTTHPLALEVTSQLLADRGATVVIGDQSGIGHVLHHPGGVIRGKTLDNYIRSGMARNNSARFVSFEEEGWDEGFFHYSSPKTSSWKDGFYITNWVRKADHIMSLPRVSTHSQAGATLGLKIMVGLLREDSRMEFHANGPYNGFIQRAAQGSSMSVADDGSGKFFEKIVEISDAVREKLRFTMFLVTEAQVTFGPDRYSVGSGNKGIGKAYITRPEPALVFGCEDQVAAEVFALALLKDLKASVPLVPLITEKIFLYLNHYVRDLSGVRVRDHPYIRHAIDIGLGEMPADIVYQDIPDEVRQRYNKYFQ